MSSFPEKPFLSGKSWAGLEIAGASVGLPPVPLQRAPVSPQHRPPPPESPAVTSATLCCVQTSMDSVFWMPRLSLGLLCFIFLLRWIYSAHDSGDCGRIVSPPCYFHTSNSRTSSCWRLCLLAFFPTIWGVTSILLLADFPAQNFLCFKQWTEYTLGCYFVLI